MATLAQVRDLSDRQVRCHVLFTEHSLWSADPDDQASDALLDMRAFGFDAAPVLPAASLTFVTTEALADAAPGAAVAAVAQPLAAADVLSVDAPLADALAQLQERPFFFLRRRREIVGIVTRADLDHPAVSALIFRSMLAIESGLDALIPSYAPRTLWWDTILLKDQKKILEVFDSRASFNAESTLFDAMMLRHRLKVLAGVPALQADVLSPETATLLEPMRKSKDSRPIDHLRNTLAHGGSLLHAFPDPERALDVLSLVESLADRVWSLVNGREQLWDAYGSTLLAATSPDSIMFNGPNAAMLHSDVLPIYAISGSNPFDRPLSDARNAARTERLAAAALRGTHHLWRGSGSSIDGTYSEQTVFAAGLDLKFALGLGARFGQRAIFRIDQDWVTALSCPGGQEIRSWHRAWAVPQGPDSRA